MSAGRVVLTLLSPGEGGMMFKILTAVVKQEILVSQICVRYEAECALTLQT